MKVSGRALKTLAGRIKMVAFDFDGVFTDNRVLVMEDGREAVFCSRSDGLGIGLLKEAGFFPLVISMETNKVVSARCKKLNIKCIQGCNDKLSVLKKEARKIGISLKQVSFVGNDINDIDCLKAVGLPICVLDSHPKALIFGKYITMTKGGFGAVREVCDLFIGRAR